MFNLNINWLKIIKENVPFFLRTPVRMDWILSMISAINQIYQEFIIQQKVYVYKIRFNGQVIYLEKILNDKFDPVGTGIYIIDGNTNVATYLYRRIELKPPLYLYKRWKSTISYNADEFAVEGNKVYKALSNNTNKKPSLYPSYWAYYKQVPFIKRRTEFYMEYSFIVKVPHTLSFDQNAMKAIIDYYRLAGKRYKIELY